MLSLLAVIIPFALLFVGGLVLRRISPKTRQPLSPDVAARQRRLSVVAIVVVVVIAFVAQRLTL